MNSPRSSIADRLAGPVSPPSKPATGTDTVVIACKIPQGITISRYVWDEIAEPSASGISRQVKISRELEGSEFVIRGPNASLPSMSPAGIYPTLVNSGGYALTPGVPGDLWDAWYEANRNSDIVRRRLVFCASDENRARDEGREMQDARTGLEPLETAPAGQPNRDHRLKGDRLTSVTWDGRRG